MKQQNGTANRLSCLFCKTVKYLNFLAGEDTSYIMDQISEELSSYEFVTPQLHRDGRWRRNIDTLVKKVRVQAGFIEILYIS